MQSGRLTPAAATSIRTSPGPGEGASTVRRRITSGPPAPSKKISHRSHGLDHAGVPIGDPLIGWLHEKIDREDEADGDDESLDDALRQPARGVDADIAADDRRDRRR